MHTYINMYVCTMCPTSFYVKVHSKILSENWSLGSHLRNRLEEAVLIQTIDNEIPPMPIFSATVISPPCTIGCATAVTMILAIEHVHLMMAPRCCVTRPTKTPPIACEITATALPTSVNTGIAVIGFPERTAPVVKTKMLNVDRQRVNILTLCFLLFIAR